ncbi:hypothetical protein LDO26_00350 [Luteimonas sp. BDR2-5]|uniref:hypothetical protein n=1 Tax=Proluteimonas luteida TaxID=2878685 RepID=UPI001E44BA2D|nr:hypothetical protein [Luteimonas sp. BDR2-5]MCD9026664.1 hypothetical protein [Luteimonas sp. BDR2-5]
MPRAKKPALPPSNTSHLFVGRKTSDRGASMTSDRIANDLADFRKSGGRIEVLGVTRTLTRLDAEAPAAKAAEAAKSGDAGRPKKRSDRG